MKKVFDELMSGLDDVETYLSENPRRNKMSNVLQDRQNQPWLQTQDSDGAHLAAKIIPGTPMHPLICQWKPQIRTGIDPKTNKPYNWDNLYMYQTTQIAEDHFVLDILHRYATPGDYAAANCFEFELQQVIGGYLYNGGIQARFDAKEWFGFGFGAKSWNSLGVQLVAGDFDQPATNLSHITAEYLRVEGFLEFLNLTVNGVGHALTYKDAAVATGEKPYLNYAWQQDSRGKGVPINCELWGYNVSTF